jgi:hypothetical protein
MKEENKVTSITAACKNYETQFEGDFCTNCEQSNRTLLKDLLADGKNLLQKIGNVT